MFKDMNITMSVTRTLLTAHALFYILVGGGLLFMPGDMMSTFFVSDREPVDPKTMDSDIEVSYGDIRSYGISLISMQVMVLGATFLDQKPVYIAALIGIIPYHATMFVLALLESHTFLIILHAAMVSIAFVLFVLVFHMAGGIAALKGLYDKLPMRKAANDSQNIGVAIEPTVSQPARPAPKGISRGLGGTGWGA